MILRDRSRMRIAEIYKSIQGEGLLTGTESIFVRASGCNLRCSFCDTRYASWEPEGEELPVNEILAEVDKLDCTHLVITGGEPMLFAEMVPLCDQLRARDRHITIETAGTCYLPVQCDLMSISPKMSNSTPHPDAAPNKWVQRHERTRHAPEVVRRLIDDYTYQLKFVIDTPADCEEVRAYVADLPAVSRQRTLLMPQGTDVQTLAGIAEWLEPYCHQEGYRFCPRRHIEWFGTARGT